LRVGQRLGLRLHLLGDSLRSIHHSRPIASTTAASTTEAVRGRSLPRRPADAQQPEQGRQPAETEQRVASLYALN
jgi:hypothetical protein